MLQWWWFFVVFTESLFWRSNFVSREAALIYIAQFSMRHHVTSSVYLRDSMLIISLHTRMRVLPGPDVSVFSLNTRMSGWDKTRFLVCFMQWPKFYVPLRHGEPSWKNLWNQIKHFHKRAHNPWFAYVVLFIFNLFSFFSTIITHPFKYLTILSYFHIEKLKGK